MTAEELTKLAQETGLDEEVLLALVKSVESKTKENCAKICEENHRNDGTPFVCRKIMRAK